MLIFKKRKDKILVNLSLDFIQQIPERNSLFIFENSLLKLDLISNTLEICNSKNLKNKVKKVKNFDRDLLFKKQLNSFLNDIKHRNKPRVNLEDSYKLLKFILNIKKNKSNSF